VHVVARHDLDLTTRMAKRRPSAVEQSAYGRVRDDPVGGLLVAVAVTVAHPSDVEAFCQGVLAGHVDAERALRPDKDEPLDAVPAKKVPEPRVAERAAVMLLDDWFLFRRERLRDDLPLPGALDQTLVGVPNPHDRTLRRARRLHEPTDGRHQLVTTGHVGHHAVLYIHNKQRRRHAISLPAYARIGNPPDQDSLSPRCSVTEVTVSLNPSDPVVVTAIFRPTNGAWDAVLAALEPAIAAVHEEPGCLLYAIHEAPDGSIVMIEKWETAALLDAHGKAAAVAALHVALTGYLAVPTEVTRLVPLPMGDESKGAL